MSYEFNESENETISKFSQMFAIVGVLVILNGLASIFVNLGNTYLVLTAILIVIIGAGFFLPYNNFKAIVTTEGEDVEQLTQAFKEMSTVFWGLTFLSVLSVLNAIVNLLG